MSEGLISVLWKSPIIIQQLMRYTNPHTTTRLALRVGRNNILINLYQIMRSNHSFVILNSKSAGTNKCVEVCVFN